MKKSIVFALLLALLLLVSCNADSEHGLYYKVSNSLPSSGIAVIGYLNYTDSYHYFYSNKGIYKVGAAGGAQILPGTGDYEIRGAYMKDADTFYFITPAGDVYEYDNGIVAKQESLTGYSMLFSNGFLYSSTQIYDLNNYSPVEAEFGGTLSTPFACGDSIIVMRGSDAKIYNRNTSGLITVSGFSSKLTGFYQLSASYLVFDGRKVYEVTASCSLGNLTPKASLPEAPSHGYKVSTYGTGIEPPYLVRTKTGFTKNGSWTAVDWLSRNSINDTNVVDMYDMGNGEIAVATYSNGIYIIDMEAEKVHEVRL